MHRLNIEVFLAYKDYINIIRKVTIFTINRMENNQVPKKQYIVLKRKKDCDILIVQKKNGIIWNNMSKK